MKIARSRHKGKGAGMRFIPERAKKFRVRALGSEFEASAHQGRHPAVDERASDDEPAEQDQRQQRLGPGLANGADVVLVRPSAAIAIASSAMSISVVTATTNTGRRCSELTTQPRRSRRRTRAPAS